MRLILGFLCRLGGVFACVSILAAGSAQSLAVNVFGRVTADEPTGPLSVVPLDIAFAIQTEIAQDLSTEFTVVGTIASFGGTIDAFRIGATDFDATNTFCGSQTRDRIVAYFREFS